MLFPKGISNIATNPSAIVTVRNVLIQKANHSIRFGFSGFPNKSLWVHQLFMLSVVHPRLNLNVSPTLVDELDQRAPMWKNFLDAKETASGRKMFHWKGKDI